VPAVGVQVGGEDAGASLASSTTAPAPSPKQHAGAAVVEVEQAFENTSAPITSAQRTPPARIIASATVSA